MYNLYMGCICNVLRINKIVCMKDSEIKWVLTLSEEDKIMFLEEMLQEQKYAMAFEFMDVLLKAPISEGGVSTDLINDVWKKYVK
jgi:hypothetical protein